MNNMNITHKLFWKCWEKFIPSFGKVMPETATKVRYRLIIKRKCDLKNPKTMTEKMQWLKLFEYSHNALITRCIDKHRVREYIEEKGCGEILNGLIGVYDDANMIDEKELPEKFVLKCNHGCGYNIICTDKSKFDFSKAKKLLNSWMHERYGADAVELVYNDIQPIITCENYIETENGLPPNDYKIFCSYGVPKLVYVISGGHGKEECLDYYTPDWQWLPVQNGNLPNAGDIHKKPENWDAMLEYARILSEDFPLVRVDLYDEFNTVIFGELTFLATGGTPIYKPAEYDFLFGKMFDISELVSRKQNK